MDLVAGLYLLIFVGKSAQKNPPVKSPAKSSKIYTIKIPNTFLQRGRANFSEDFDDAKSLNSCVNKLSGNDFRKNLVLRGQGATR